jgi:hypothetical protein
VILGTPVEVGAPDFEIPAPVVDVSAAMEPLRLVADAERALVRVGGLGTFAISGGRQVRLEPEPEPAWEDASSWLYGIVSAVLLAQRRRFALHASVVDLDGVAVAVAGVSGSGKSTTALRLTQAGHRLVADDLSPLDVSAPPTVHPLPRPLHVWPHTAQALGLDLARAAPDRAGRAKLAVPAPPSIPARVSALVVLVPRDEARGVEVRSVGGAGAHALVRRNAYLARIVEVLYRAELFAWASAIAGQVAIHELIRPTATWSADEVAAAVEGIAARQTT